ncbi:NAD-dependent epimerase/dehydratase family protein [Candidatus Omnitrophota bacterium]
MMRYLITGGTGFIGAALVQRLVKEGHSVRVLDNNIRGTSERLKGVSKDIELIQADIRDAEAVQYACKKIDSVCHLAFINGTEFFYTQPELVLEVGVRGMLNLLDACRREDVGELMLASSSEVYQAAPTVPTDETVPLSIPDPFNPRYSYAAGKIISELMAINYGRKYFKRVVIFRPHNVYGPDMGWEHVIPQFVIRMRRLCKESLKGKIRFPIQGTGGETRAFVFIEDFIDGLIILMEKGKHLNIYNIGTREELTIEKVAYAVGEYFNREIEVVPGKSAEGGTRRRCPDISKIISLGYGPRYKFSDGLPIIASWYDENADKTPRKGR